MQTKGLVSRFRQIGFCALLGVAPFIAGCGQGTSFSEAEIRTELRANIASGMTRAEVEALIGVGEPPSEMESMVLKEGMTNPSDPSMAPDGYEPDDTFYSYTLDGVKVFVQYRDDALINFNPQLY